MAFGKSSACSNEHYVGVSPVSFFCIGAFEICLSLFIAAVIFRRQWLSRISQSTYVSYILPIYLSAVVVILVVGVLMGIDGVIGFYVADIEVYLLKWFVLRIMTESLSIFLLHSSIGQRSLRTSLLCGVGSSLTFITVVITAYVQFDSFQQFILVPLMCIGFLVVYYALIVLLPVSVLPRRPALDTYALLTCLLLVTQLAAVAYIFAAGEHNDSARCSIEMVFSLNEFVQLIVILIAFSQDSAFWQGLYTNDSSNLNQPLLGVWDMNRQTVQMVTESIMELEQHVVTIIPFSKLRVDTSFYFSGGSARVYRGTFEEKEVAVKMLFCMELSAERIMDFCAEASLLSSLQHPNIVTCYGVAIMPPAMSLVTEFCMYGSLFDLLHSTDVIENSRGNDNLPPASTAATTTSYTDRFSLSGGPWAGAVSPVLEDDDRNDNEYNSERDRVFSSGTAISNITGYKSSNSSSFNFNVQQPQHTLNKPLLDPEQPMGSPSEVVGVIDMGTPSEERGIIYDDDRSTTTSTSKSSKGRTAASVATVASEIFSPFDVTNNENFVSPQCSSGQSESEHSAASATAYKAMDSSASSTSNGYNTNTNTYNINTNNNHDAEMNFLQSDTDVATRLALAMEESVVDHHHRQQQQQQYPASRTSFSSGGLRNLNRDASACVDVALRSVNSIDGRCLSASMSFNSEVGSVATISGKLLPTSVEHSATTNRVVGNSIAIESGRGSFNYGVNNNSSGKSAVANSANNSNKKARKEGRLRSATSVLLSREMGFGLGPTNSNSGSFGHFSGNRKELVLIEDRGSDSSIVSGGCAAAAATGSDTVLGAAENGTAAPPRHRSRTSSYNFKFTAKHMQQERQQQQQQPSRLRSDSSRRRSDDSTASQSRGALSGDSSNRISGAGGALSGSSRLVLLSCLNSSLHSLGNVLPQAVRLRMCRDCAAGLAYAHSKNILHADVKSLNFLVTSNMVVKLADMGEARHMEHGYVAQEHVKAMPRNVNWSAPELFSDDPAVKIEKSADVWSLAMVMSEIFTGVVPFDTESCRAMSLQLFIDHIKGGARPSIPLQYAQIAWIKQMMNDAWALEPEKRITAANVYAMIDQRL